MSIKRVSANKAIISISIVGSRRCFVKEVIIPDDLTKEEIDLLLMYEEVCFEDELLEKMHLKD